MIGYTAECLTCDLQFALSVEVQFTMSKHAMHFERSRTSKPELNNQKRKGKQTNREFIQSFFSIPLILFGWAENRNINKDSNEMKKEKIWKNRNSCKTRMPQAMNITKKKRKKQLSKTRWMRSKPTVNTI